MDIQALKSYNILLLGDSCTDMYHYGVCERLSQEAPVPVFKLISTEHKPGMASNVEKNILAFNNKVTLISNDPSLITKERFIDNKFNQQLLRIDKGEGASLQPLSKIPSNIEDYDCVVISDYNKGFLRHEECLKISSLCTRHKIPFFVDSKKQDLSCFEGAILKINKKEAEQVIKYPINYDIIITLGGAGAQWLGHYIPSIATEVFDVCGAGDTFFASLVEEYLNTKDMIKSIQYANRCASITVSKIGAHALTAEEVCEVNEIKV